MMDVPPRSVPLEVCMQSRHLVLFVAVQASISTLPCAQILHCTHVLPSTYVPLAHLHRDGGTVPDGRMDTKS